MKTLTKTTISPPLPEVGLHVLDSVLFYTQWSHCLDVFWRPSVLRGFTLRRIFIPKYPVLPQDTSLSHCVYRCSYHILPELSFRQKLIPNLTHNGVLSDEDKLYHGLLVSYYALSRFMHLRRRNYNYSLGFWSSGKINHMHFLYARYSETTCFYSKWWQ